MSQVWFLDRSPAEAARAVADAHLDSALVGGLRLLSSAHHRLTPERVRWDVQEVVRHGVRVREREPYLLQPAGGYSLVYRGGGGLALVGWVTETSANYLWLAEHVEALVEEAQYRRGKSLDVIPVRLALRHPPETISFTRAVTPIARPPLPGRAQPCSTVAETVAAYREHYHVFMKRSATWTNRRPPGWWIPDQEN